MLAESYLEQGWLGVALVSNLLPGLPHAFECTLSFPALPPNPFFYLTMELQVIIKIFVEAIIPTQVGHLFYNCEALFLMLSRKRWDLWIKQIYLALLSMILLNNRVIEVVSVALIFMLHLWHFHELLEMLWHLIFQPWLRKKSSPGMFCECVGIHQGRFAFPHLEFK